MEFKFSFNRKGSQHVQQSNWSQNVANEFYDFINFRPRDYGNTLRYITSYNKNPLVYTVVNKIASSATGLPTKVVNDNKEEVKTSKIDMVLNNPNEDQSRGEFFQNIYEYLLLSGNGFIRNISGIGAGNTLKVLESQNVTINIDSRGDLLGYTYRNNMGKNETLKPEEVLHVKLNSSLVTDRDTKYWGTSPLNAMWQVVTSSNDLFTARSVLWKNKGVIGMITNNADTPLLPKERDAIQDKFNEQTGGAEKANSMHVSTNKLAYIQTGMSPGDLKLLEGNIDNLRIISAGYRLPSVVVGDVENSTYNNVLESKKEAYTEAYIPVANRVNEKLSAWLSDILKVKETIIIDITRIEVLKTTTHEVSNRLNNLPTNVAARVMETMTVDEVRDMVGLEETKQDGDQLLGAANSITLTNGQGN